MNDLSDPHAPTPEFEASLENQIARAFRAELQFDPQRDVRRHRFGVVMGLVAGSVVILTIGLVLGASTGYASAEVLHARASHDTTIPPEPGHFILRTIPVRTTFNVVTCAAASLAQPAPSVKEEPTLVTLETTTRSSESFGAVLGVRESAEGKVLVNDAGRRQIKLLDTTLATSTTALDSMPGTSTSYGRRASPLIPFIGDSSLLPDWSSRTMLVLDGRGRVSRSLALPRPTDMTALTNSPAFTDNQGRLVFRSLRLPGNEAMTHMVYGDSMAILRADLEFRRIDTVGRIARPLMKITAEKRSDGKQTTVYAPDPLQTNDDWAVLANGSVAIVRGHDYHLDLVSPDGAVTAAPKLPLTWKRLTDDVKQRLTDSVRAAQNDLLAIGYPRAEFWLTTGVSCEAPPGLNANGARSGRGGGVGTPPADDGGNCTSVLLNATLATGGPATRTPIAPLADLFRAGPVFDYEPPMQPAATMPDRDGNLWILPRTSALSKSGELVYDVVDAKGALLERVRLPLGRALAGFGKNGVVFLVAGDRATGYYLERGRLPQKK
jgi:hypothetical protein